MAVVLRVCDVKAENLPSVDKKSASDPYASLEFKGNACTKFKILDYSELCPSMIQLIIINS